MNVVGVRILDGRVTDLLEARAINYAYQHIDIYSASWGPRDNGKTMEGPGTFCGEALRKGVQQVHTFLFIYLMMYVRYCTFGNLH